jgi:aminoglycoside 6'-N-acetyltransferase I
MAVGLGGAVALVTGGANGIGAAAPRRLAARGARPSSRRPAILSIHWAVWLKGVIAQAMGTMARRRPPKLVGGTPEGPVQIERLRVEDVPAAIELVTRVQRVDPGDRGEQFASDITDDSRQMFVAKANGHVIAYGRVAELTAGEVAPGTPAGCYLTGVLVDPAWRHRGVATALTRARLRWVFARTDEALYVAGADNTASLNLHAALGFQEMKRFESERSVAGLDVLSRLTRTAASPDVRRGT